MRLAVKDESTCTEPIVVEMTYKSLGLEIQKAAGQNTDDLYSFSLFNRNLTMDWFFRELNHNAVNAPERE